MAKIEIDDASDPRIRIYRDLPASHSVSRYPQFIVEGRLLIERLVNSGLSIESVVVDRDRLSLLPPYVTRRL